MVPRGPAGPSRRALATGGASLSAHPRARVVAGLPSSLPARSSHRPKLVLAASCSSRTSAGRGRPAGLTYDQGAVDVNSGAARSGRGGIRSGQVRRWSPGPVEAHADAARGDGSRSMGGKDEPLRGSPWSDRDADPNRQAPS
jgi:hypothetical protein